jgi:nucleoside-diphosphate-sugar epimerase
MVFRPCRRRRGRNPAGSGTRAARYLQIVDDDPAPVSDWLPTLAKAVGAPPPLRIPVFIARLAIEAHGISLMNEIRGASNAKAKRELSWKPFYPTWRSGFWEGLS